MVDNKSKNFTIENGVYKGQEDHYLTHYKSFGELLWITIKSHGDKISHLDACTEETVTYAQLQDKVVRCALWLQKQEIKPGDIISMCTGNHINSIVPCLAATYINAIFNPWNADLDFQNVKYFLKMMTPKIIFCSEKSVNVVLSVLKEQNCNSTVVVFGEHADAISFSDILEDCNDMEVANFRYAELDDIKKTTCIMHSSGTTGMPKGVELSNYAMLILSQQNLINLTDMPSLWYSSLYWITGIMMNFNGIKQSTTAVIYPEFDEEMTCRLIEKYKISVVFLSPSMISRLVNSGCIKKYPLSSLKAIMYGGSSIQPKVEGELKRILSHVQIVQGYGITELCGCIAMQLPNSKSGSCGTVYRNVQIKVVDTESGKVLGPNQLGELWLKSIRMMNGYYKNPEATKNTIDEDGWMHSGDIGYMDEDGELFITGRIKDLIKYRGCQVSPGEIERVLISHPAVLEAVVVGVPHALDDEHPLAYVIKRPGAKVTEQELIDIVAKNMMDHNKLRAGVIFLDSFPYTVSGKISKKDLKAMTEKLMHDD